MKRETLSIRDICVTAIFTAFTAVCAQISIPLPFSPIPISCGMVGIYTAATLLSPRCAILSQVCYLLLGAVGAPVFAGFQGGLGRLLGPTGGFLIAYPVLAAIISITLNGKRALASEPTKRRVFARGAVSICLSHLLLYLCGTVWLCIITGNTFIAGLALAVLPYIPLDVVKIIFCVVAIIPLRGRVMKTGLLTGHAR